MRAVRALVVVLSLACPLAWGVPIYRWVDGQGVTQYSDVPPRGLAVDVVDMAPLPEPQASSDVAKVGAELRASRQARERELDAQLRERHQRAEREAVARGAGVPVGGETLALPVLQTRILGALVVAEQAVAPECSEHRVVGTEVLSRDADQRSIVERWSLDRCGSPVAYRVEIVPYQPALRGIVVVDELASVTFSREDAATGR